MIIETLVGGLLSHNNNEKRRIETAREEFKKLNELQQYQYEEKYFTKDLLWDWKYDKAKTILENCISKDKYLSPLYPFNIKFAISNNDTTKNVENISFTLCFTVYTTKLREEDVKKRIQWLLRHIKVLPSVWYDEDGEPYISSIGGAAIRNMF